MSRQTTVAASLLFLSGLACSGLVPAEIPDTHRAYLGTWTNAEVRLQITPDGMLHYKRQSGARSSELNLPIQAWSETGFTVGLGPMTTDFTVQSPPTKEGNVWTMVVDGHTLTRR